MTFDELQKRWQSQESGFRLSIDSDMLLREVKRNKRYFESMIFWRDVREVGGFFLGFIFLVCYGLKSNLWPLLVLALLCFGVGVFMIVDRIVQKRKRPEFSDSLEGCIESSLVQVKHQIWLLKNVLWWYFLPPTVGISVFYVYLAWRLRDLGPIVWTVILAIFALTILVYWGGYLLNQKAVRKELVPRKQELEQILNSLKNANGI